MSTWAFGKHALWTSMLIVVCGALGQDNGQSACDKIKSSSPEVRNAGIEEALKERREFITKLISIAKDGELGKTNPAARVAAVGVLGEIRATEAIDVLLERIDEIQPLASHNTLGSQDDPCVHALVKIGKAASLATISRLSLRDPSDREQKMCLRVILEVEGKDVALYMLEQAAKSETDVKRKGRLENAHKVLKSMGK